MLLVKTYVGPSVIRGLGLFASEDIPAGTRIYRNHPGTCLCYCEEDWQMLRETAGYSFAQIEKYAVKYRGDGLYYLPLDDTRFVNHSETDFNCGILNDGEETYAIRDIRKGEELLDNYRLYYDPEFFEYIMTIP
jgi:SET domain-containing protein